MYLFFFLLLIVLYIKVISAFHISFLFFSLFFFFVGFIMLAANSKPLSTSTSTTTTDTDLTNTNPTYESLFYTPSSFFVPNPPTRHEEKNSIEGFSASSSDSFFQTLVNLEESSGTCLAKNDSQFDLAFARQYQGSSFKSNYNPASYATKLSYTQVRKELGNTKHEMTDLYFSRNNQLITIHFT